MLQPNINWKPLEIRTLARNQIKHTLYYVIKFSDKKIIVLDSKYVHSLLILKHNYYRQRYYKRII